MKGLKLIITFRNNNAFLCHEVALDFQQVNLPPVARNFDPPVSWEILVLHHNPADNSIFVDVLKYHSMEIAFPAHQQEWFDELMMVGKVTFRNIDTFALLHSLKKPDILINRPVHLHQSEMIDEDEDEDDETGFLLEKLSDGAKRRKLEETQQIAIKDLRFKLGGVSFSTVMRGHVQLIEFTISNYDIREEYDAVKNYFANILKTKKITVHLKVETEDGEVVSKSAESPQISQINEKLIDSVKFEFVRKTIKKRPRTEIDKTLFTMDEYFETFMDEKPKAGAFFKDESDLLENLLQISHTKHYKHLRYLSSIHAHRIMKLRFIHQPFSFVFLVEGERNYHIIWETLDTEEATWIWHCEKNIQSLKENLRKVEDIINTVKVLGKTAYINSHEDPFRRIFHDYSDLREGFVVWKDQLRNYLT